jgi:hypothetical protein
VITTGLRQSARRNATVAVMRVRAAECVIAFVAKKSWAGFERREPLTPKRCLHRAHGTGRGCTPALNLFDPARTNGEFGSPMSRFSRTFQVGAG